jgi:hypothetical protein
MSSEIAALDELKGRLTFIKVQYIDTVSRVQPAIECIMRMMHDASKGPLTPKQIDELSEELYDLRSYLLWLKSEYSETSKEVDPVINVINWLMSSEDQTKH